MATDRRTFIKVAGAGTAGLAMRPASSYARILGANDRVRVGIVGYSDRSRGALIPAFMAQAEAHNFELVAVSDIWNRRRDECVAHVETLAGKTVAAGRNNEELYERNDVDAVIIATADHQHAYHCIEAVTAGRDCYVEKPFAHTMKHARDARQAVKESGQIMQVGTQRRSAANYQAAAEFIQSGKFGDLVMVEMTWNVNQPGRWRRQRLVQEIRQEDTDWKRFLIDYADDAWDPRKYLEFRLFWPYSSGIPDQWMVHQIDTVHWFTALPHPRSVVANGGVYLWKDGRTNWDTFTGVYDYGPLDDPSKGFQVIYTSRMTNSAGDVKEIYRSNGGTLDLDESTVTPEGGLEPRAARAMGMEANLLSEQSLSAAAKAETGADTGADNATSANMRNWMECVRSRKTPNADIEAAYNHSVALCMTVAAMQTGQRITFDDEKQDVVIGGGGSSGTQE
ncbi:MAG: gfo/Idh/MocA family oxidoreductase [Luteitalea sp.]|nr:gfo/Idh/MocA family oxidoreductase [Luteitalea sp.]